MLAAAIFTSVLAALTILVLAAYLIRVARVLVRINAKLRDVTAGLHLVPQRTEPVGAILGDINNNLAGVDKALKGVLARS
jgi:hypothetical protein